VWCLEVAGGERDRDGGGICSYGTVKMGGEEE
jgi:hypothetical protein